MAGGVSPMTAGCRTIAPTRPSAMLRLADATSLLGKHNWQNAAAAFAACAAIGLAKSKIVAGITSYPGLAHRQELIATIGDVRYINDSKATNADAAAKALACYQPIYWILGGTREGDWPRRCSSPSIRASLHAFLDRRGERALRRRRSRAASPARSAARSPPRSRPPIAEAQRRAQAGRGRAAVAGRRLVRPVRRFRGARRGLPQLVEALCVGPMQTNGGAVSRRMQ